MSLVSSIESIDQWYRKKCNGQWEHFEGIQIETTDNPGWLATVNSLPLNNHTLAPLLGKLLTDFEAQVSTDGSMVRVFAPKLQDCLTALSMIIEMRIREED